MSKYSKRRNIILSVFISIVIYISIYFFLNMLNQNQKKDKKFNSNSNAETVKYSESNIQETIINEVDEVIENQYKDNNWRIFISKINLDAPILEGTSKEILRRGVGHFEETNKWNGNVVLAAHNRGYKYNFFQEIKKLSIGDVIKYQTDEGNRSYSVISNEKIKETDLSCLEDTNENQLTLITCVENMPEYRICVKAKQIA